MLRSIHLLYGDKLGASDGEIGHVKDFYFDDHDWTVRYVVADTGTWLNSRMVLVSPHAIVRLEQIGKVFRVNLTREQLEKSPSVESHKPVSRQYEEEYFRYYGWPFYWQGDALWGASGYPISDALSNPMLDEAVVAETLRSRRADAHLQSTQAVKGYHVKGTDGIHGHVDDFMMDDRSWAITKLCVKTGNRLSGKVVEIPVRKVVRISYEESTVFVSLSTEDIDLSPLPAPAHPLIAH